MRSKELQVNAREIRFGELLQAPPSIDPLFALADASRMLGDRLE